MNTVQKRNNIKSILLKFLPGYGWKALIIMYTINVLVYNGSRFLTQNRHHYLLDFSLDKMIPFVAEFVIVYIPIAYLQWIIGFITIGRARKDICYQVISGEIISKLMCLAFFLIFPTTLIRPEISGNDFFSEFVKWVYRMDTPDNLLPSVHCLESWVVTRGCFKINSLPKWVNPLNVIITILVFLSTVFIKQHLIIDVVMGVLVAEAGQLIMKYVMKKIKAHDNAKLKKEVPMS